MAVGQAVMTSALDVGALNAVEARLEVHGVAVCQSQDELRADEASDAGRIGDALRDDDGWGLTVDDPYRYTG